MLLIYSYIFTFLDSVKAILVHRAHRLLSESTRILCTSCSEARTLSAFERFVDYEWWSSRYRTPDCGALRRGISEEPGVFSIFSSVQSLSFLPAIFRGLLQELR